MGNISTGAVAGRIGNHNNCMSIHCPLVLSSAHFPGEPLPVVDGLVANVDRLKLYALRVRSFNDILVQISRDTQMLLKSVVLGEGGFQEACEFGFKTKSFFFQATPM